MTQSPFFTADPRDNGRLGNGPVFATRRAERRGKLPAPGEPPRSSRRERRRIRNAACRHGTLGFPAFGAHPLASTPAVDELDAAYRARVNELLAAALRVALPLRQRRAELLEWIMLSEHGVAESRRRRGGLPRRGVRDRRRGEEHLSNAELAHRTRLEDERARNSAEIDVRNRETMLSACRVGLQWVEEQLDGIASMAQIRADAARWAAVRQLCGYVDELLRHHPDGKLINDLGWPVGFAEPPEWVDHATAAQRLICGRIRDGGRTDELA